MTFKKSHSHLRHRLISCFECFCRSQVSIIHSNLFRLVSAMVWFGVVWCGVAFWFSFHARVCVLGGGAGGGAGGGRWRGDEILNEAGLPLNTVFRPLSHSPPQ